MPAPRFEAGASATVELAHQILALHKMVEPDDGITINTAPVWGGTRPNVIAAEAGCEIDLRVNSHRDGELMEQRASWAWTAVTAGCPVIVEGGMNRPPFAENPAIRSLYEKARAIAGQVGVALPRQHRGGGSDGNFTAAMGIPTLDGLGCPGAGAHASHEHILWRRPGAAGGADGGIAGDAVTGSSASRAHAVQLAGLHRLLPAGRARPVLPARGQPAGAAGAWWCWPRSASTPGGTSASFRCSSG